MGIKGLSEETTTGVLRLYDRMKAGNTSHASDQCQRLSDEVEI